MKQLIILTLVLVTYGFSQCPSGAMPRTDGVWVYCCWTTNGQCYSTGQRAPQQYQVAPVYKSTYQSSRGKCNQSCLDTYKRCVKTDNSIANCYTYQRTCQEYCKQ